MEIIDLLDLLTRNFELLIALAVIILGILLAGYWFLFMQPQKIPYWVGKYRQKFKELNAKDLEKKYQVIELDKLLENVLKEKYNLDKGLGDILKKKAKKFSRTDLNEIWKAHKLRNKLIHDSDFEASQTEMNHAVIVFKRTLKRLLRV